MKTDALPGGAAVVVVARHPAHAGVVSAEFGERRRAGNGIRHVIVAAVGMRDGVPANRAGATLKPNDLALKAIIARQDDAATVQKREEIAEQFTLGFVLVAPLILAPPLQQAVVPIATIPLSQSMLLALTGPAQAASTLAFGLVVGRYRLAVAACNHLHNLLYWNEHQE